MNIKTAHTLASISKLVYSDESEVESGAYEMGFPEFAWFDADGTQAAVLSNDEDCVLAFRGTTDITDWMTNLDVFKTRGRFGEVHNGFQEALNLVWDDIEPVLAQYGDKDLYITGHSLGGALATLALTETGQGELYTFGSPRVGDEEFKNIFNHLYKTYRFQNNNDVVPRVPRSGYKHIGSLRYFTVGGKMLAEPGIWRIEMDRFWGRMMRIVADGIKDHDIGEYADLVEEQMLD